MENDKSAGIEGNPMEFYKAFCQFLEQDLQYRCTTIVQQYFMEKKSTKTMNQALVL